MAHRTAPHLGVVRLEEIYVVVQDLDEELRVDPARDAHVGDLEGPLQALQHSARVAASGCLLRGEGKKTRKTEAQKKTQGEGRSSISRATKRDKGTRTSKKINCGGPLVQHGGRKERPTHTNKPAIRAVNFARLLTCKEPSYTLVGGNTVFVAKGDQPTRVISRRRYRVTAVVPGRHLSTRSPPRPPPTSSGAQNRWLQSVTIRHWSGFFRSLAAYWAVLVARES